MQRESPELAERFRAIALVWDTASAPVQAFSLSMLDAVARQLAAGQQEDAAS